MQKQWNLYNASYNEKVIIEVPCGGIIGSVGVTGHKLVIEHVGLSKWRTYAVAKGVDAGTDMPPNGLDNFEIASPGFHTSEECYDWWEENWKSVSSEKTSCDHTDCWRCPRRCTKHCGKCVRGMLNSQYKVHSFPVRTIYYDGDPIGADAYDVDTDTDDE